MKELIRSACLLFVLAAVACAADSCQPRSRFDRHLARCGHCGFIPSEPGEFAPPLTDCPELRRLSKGYAAARKGGRNDH